MPGNAELIGAISTEIYFAVCIAIFVLRLLGKIGQSQRIGFWQTLLMMAPVIYLMAIAIQEGRSVLFFIQVTLMLAYLVLEFLLDFVFKVDFRQVRWMTITYVILFFAATGGMLGITSQAGLAWTISAVCLFLVVAALVFVQRYKTGL